MFSPGVFISVICVKNKNLSFYAVYLKLTNNSELSCLPSVLHSAVWDALPEWVNGPAVVWAADEHNAAFELRRFMFTKPSWQSAHGVAVVITQEGHGRVRKTARYKLQMKTPPDNADSALRMLYLSK